jgi:hypothetical protein
MNILPFKDRSALLNHYVAALRQTGSSVEYSCEVGVWQGDYSRDICSRLQNSLKKHYLVDPWAPQETQIYKDECNKPEKRQEECLERTKEQLSRWSDKLHFLRGLSLDMCHEIPDNSLDFCYIDARHDYLGCKEDIEAYWPKVKSGRILAGHDYLDADECKRLMEKLGWVVRNDWSLCYDGSYNSGAVKGAVNEFAERNDLQVLVTYGDHWNTWVVVKP